MKKILVVNNDFDTMTLLKSWLEKKLTRSNIQAARKKSLKL